MFNSEMLNQMLHTVTIKLRNLFIPLLNINDSVTTRSSARGEGPHDRHGIYFLISGSKNLYIKKLVTLISGD